MADHGRESSPGERTPDERDERRKGNGPASSLPRDLAALERFAWILDRAIPLPRVQRRVGVSPLIGLVPGIGDAIGALLATWILIGALRHRVPVRTLLRMTRNVVVNLVIGAIPVVGDLYDFVFPENLTNVDLLLRDRDRSRPPRPLWHIALGAALVTMTIALVSVAVIVALLFAGVWAWQHLVPW